MYKIVPIDFFLSLETNVTIHWLGFADFMYYQLLLSFLLDLRAHVQLLLSLGWPMIDQWVICFPLLCITALGLLLTSPPPLLPSPIHSFPVARSIFLK